MFNIYSISQTKPLTFFLKLDPLFGFLSTVKGTTSHCFHVKNAGVTFNTPFAQGQTTKSPWFYLYLLRSSCGLFDLFYHHNHFQLPSRYSTLELSQEPSNSPSAADKLLTLSPVTAYSSFLNHLSFPWGSLSYLVYCSYKFLLYYACYTPHPNLSMSIPDLTSGPSTWLRRDIMVWCTPVCPISYHAKQL